MMRFEDLIKGLEFFEHVQNLEYDKKNLEIKEKLQKFRNDFKEFSDGIAQKNSLVPVPHGYGNWLKANGKSFQSYIWNRYKPKDFLNMNNHLVIYFTAATSKSDLDKGLYMGIGLIDDKVNELEEKNYEKIYEYLDKECQKIDCKGFDNIAHHFKIIDIQNANYECLILNLLRIYKEVVEKFYLTFSSKINNNDIEILSLNQILYGPPGTGKTYDVTYRAVAIIENKSLDELYEEGFQSVKQRFDDYRQQGQIEFITFHQSYSYEDFIEGLKAEIEGKSIKYEIKDGIFKEISLNAKENYENSKQKEALNVKKLIEDFANFVNEKINNNELIQLENTSFYIKEVNYDTNGDIQSFIIGGENRLPQYLTKDIIVRDIKDFLQNKITSYKDIKPSHKSKSPYHGNAIYYYEL